MNQKIQRPTDDYSPNWNSYWAQNPNEARGVGADGANQGADVKPPDVKAPDVAELTALLKQRDDSIAKLEANSQELRQEKAEAKKIADAAAKEAKKIADKAAQDAAKSSGDMDAYRTSIEQSFLEKLTGEIAPRDEKLKSYEQIFHNLTIGSEATRLAAKLGMDKSQSVLELWIKQRLTSEIKDGMPVVRVLSKEGKPSGMTMQDLEDEINKTESLAPLLVGSKASGPGPAGHNRGNTNPKAMKRSEWDRLDPRAKAAQMKNGGITD